jgi:hypothetical protein
MKSRLVLVCSILVAVAVALGCGQTTPPPPKDEEPSAAVNAELASMQGEWKVSWEGDPVGVLYDSVTKRENYSRDQVFEATIEKDLLRLFLVPRGRAYFASRKIIIIPKSDLKLMELGGREGPPIFGKSRQPAPPDKYQVNYTLEDETLTLVFVNGGKMILARGKARKKQEEKEEQAIRKREEAARTKDKK